MEKILNVNLPQTVSVDNVVVSAREDGHIVMGWLVGDLLIYFENDAYSDKGMLVFYDNLEEFFEDIKYDGYALNGFIDSDFENKAFSWYRKQSIEEGNEDYKGAYEILKINLKR
ncbi:MAG: hypothetical protein ACOCQR_00775 [bacterium]